MKRLVLSTAIAALLVAVAPVAAQAGFNPSAPSAAPVTTFDAVMGTDAAPAPQAEVKAEKKVKKMKKKAAKKVETK